MQSITLLWCSILLSLSPWETADGSKTEIYGRRQRTDSEWLEMPLMDYRRMCRDGREKAKVLPERHVICSRLIYADRVTQPSKLLTVVQEQRDYPGVYRPKGMISCINVTEISGQGGTARVLEGGVGSLSVKLAFSSERSYDFLIAIYGFDVK